MNMPKRKVGDKVKVRKDLEDKCLGGSYRKMVIALRGTVVTITGVLGKLYTIEEDGNTFYWADEMFEDGPSPAGKEPECSEQCSLGLRANQSETDRRSYIPIDAVKERMEWLIKRVKGE